MCIRCVHVYKLSVSCVANVECGMCSILFVVMTETLAAVVLSQQQCRKYFDVNPANIQDTSFPCLNNSKLQLRI